MHVFEFRLSHELLRSAELESLRVTGVSTHGGVHGACTMTSGSRLAQVIKSWLNVGVSNSVRLQRLEVTNLLAVLHKGHRAAVATFLAIGLVVCALVSNGVAQGH